ncbi:MULTISPECIES: hypothetical protein [unclassified Streptomyces]|uniref:hypothetical protein n=1 Tax=unclassified Streptomyces TaxID=2593676 RepID=UPI0038038D07
MFRYGKAAGLRGVGAWVVAGVVLVGAGGCSGEGDRDGATVDGKASASAVPAPPAPLGQALLTAASLTDGERVGRYTVSEYALGAPLGEDYTAEPAVCQPLVSLAGGATAFEPAAEVHRRAEVPGGTLGVTVSVQLRSYADGGAAGVMSALREAGRECADGFTEVRATARAAYLKVEPDRAPDVGDEATAYRFTVRDVKGVLKLYEYLTVVRSGSTTLSFRAEILGTEDVGGVPDDLVRAQWQKFRAAR